MASRPLPLLLLGLVLSVGCDDPEHLRSLDLAELPERFACNDVTMVAATVDGSEALLVGIADALAAKAKTSGEMIEADYELPDERLTVRWVAGSNVAQGQCGRDGGGTWRLDERREAVAGHINVRVIPEADGRLTLSASFDEILLESANTKATTYELTTHLDRLPLEQ
jgi:hypothetical protein